MSEPLFDVELPTPVVAAAPEPEKVTERTMLDLLAQRYTRVSMGAHRYAYAEHVADRPGFASRIADFIAVDCYGHGGYGPERRYAVHGHEVKVSRSDWLTELRDPLKAEAFRPYCHQWWLVVASPSIVRDGELPDGWGLMIKTGAALRAVKPAPRSQPEPMPPALFASLMRAIAKTARAVSSVVSTEEQP